MGFHLFRTSSKLNQTLYCCLIAILQQLSKEGNIIFPTLQLRTPKLRRLHNMFPQIVNGRAGNPSCSLRSLSTVLFELTIHFLFVSDKIVFFQLQEGKLGNLPQKAMNAVVLSISAFSPLSALYYDGPFSLTEGTVAGTVTEMREC